MNTPNGRKIESYLQNIEQTAVDVLSTLAPWLGPIPSAYLVGQACLIHLSWHWSVALVAAIAIEAIGVVSVILALQCHEWNAARTQKDAEAPYLLAVALVVVYFVITVLLTIFLDVAPTLAKFAPAVFPLLAAVGAVNIAVKNGLYRRQEIARNRKGQRRAKSAAQTANSTPQISQTETTVSVYRCGCGKSYEKPQSYSAHKRHCQVNKQGVLSGNKDGYVIEMKGKVNG